MGNNNQRSKRNTITTRASTPTRASSGGKYGRINKFVSTLSNDTSGDAVVEATILFPVMIMIFAVLVLLSIYLPARAALQQATQQAAIALATELSDTWLFYDTGSMTISSINNKSQLVNVYVDLFTTSGDIDSKAEAIVTHAESQSFSSRTGTLTVEAHSVNNILFREIIVIAEREFPMPVDFSFIGFPGTISLTVTSSAVVQNGDEFIRNIDIASDFLEFIIDRFNLHSITDAISSFGSRVTGLLGW